jgi:hypothetical protein
VNNCNGYVPSVIRFNRVVKQLRPSGLRVRE